MMTVFPRACSFTKRRNASGVSRSGYVLSITGVTLPASMRSFSHARFRLLGTARYMLPCSRLTSASAYALNT